jgi:pectate lyase
VGTGTASGIAYGYGVRVDGALEVLLQNVGIRDYQSGDATAVQITSAWQVRVTVDNCTIYNNQVGVLVTDNGGTGTSRCSARCCWPITPPGCGW